MRVQVYWREVTYHTASMDGPSEDVLREWLADSGVPDAPIDGPLVKEWWENGDVDEWHVTASRYSIAAGPTEVELEEVVVEL